MHLGVTLFAYQLSAVTHSQLGADNDLTLAEELAFARKTDLTIKHSKTFSYLITMIQKWPLHF